VDALSLDDIDSLLGGAELPDAAPDREKADVK